MIALDSFTFDANGQAFTVQAVNPVQAFGAANLHCEQAGIELPQGAWMETLAPKGYRWAPGNFFD